MRQGLLKLAWVNPAFMAEPSNRPDRRRAEKEGRISATDARPSQPQYKTIIFTALITASISIPLTGLVMGFMPYLFGLFRGDLKTSIVNEINQTLAPISQDVGDLKTQVAVLKKSIENLEKFGPIGRLKTQATKLGIKDPQITSVDLKSQATFSAFYIAQENPSNFARVDFYFEEVGKDFIVLTVRGDTFSGGKLLGQIGPSRQKVRLDRKAFTFELDAKTKDGIKVPMPTLRIAILDRDDANNRLTIATGTATTPTT